MRGEGSEALENEGFNVPIHRLIRSIGRQIGKPLHVGSSYYPHSLDNFGNPRNPVDLELGRTH